MFKFFDEIFQSEFPLTKRIVIKGIDVFLFAVITVMAIAARVVMFSYVSRDYTIFLKPWFDELAGAGGLRGFGVSIGDYTPTYIYIMTLLTKLPIDSLVSIKLVSVIFDFVGAVVALLIVTRTCYARYHTVPALAAYAVFLFAPTICLNSAMWAQCDIIFTTFLLLCIYQFIKNKPFSGTIMFGIAFALKLQAIFLAPLLILLWVRGKMKFRHFFLIPAVYIVSILPALIMGRPLKELLTIYMSQAGQYNSLSLNAPNLYMWLNSDKSEVISAFGIILTAAAILFIICYVIRERPPLGRREIVAFSLLFALLMPFLLPHMHERYFYVADVLSILYAFTFRKRAIVPITVILSSLLSYAPYLFGNTPISLGVVALFVLGIIALIIRDLFSDSKLIGNATKLTN